MFLSNFFITTVIIIQRKQTKAVLFLAQNRLTSSQDVFNTTLIEFDSGSGRTLAACLIHASRADVAIH